MIMKSSLGKHRFVKKRMVPIPKETYATFVANFPISKQDEVCVMTYFLSVMFLEKK